MMITKKIIFQHQNSSTWYRVLLFCLSLVLFTACGNDDSEDVVQKQRELDEQIIKKYLEDNNLQATRTSSGLYYSITEPTTGPQPVKGNGVSVLYTGKLLDGKVFDSTSSRGNQPFNFILGAGQVIKGWDEGIALMKKGEKAVLYIPSGLAYGPQAKSNIPANSVLIFDVELVEIVR
ncbi:MAG: FKBP-type peptidyl-prolyl cis-trans isomerase [Hymenobacteraceae bacterium]|nr:FKBP-type peptidyl-prolyl cis-trans isomerase [Hymenobacteraceae bacterium]MDX5395618.1 FKBP-type peptidyl-prolyl cis-trans isomerase [Hymenobacteraceae bacterium]MDX5511672.1 FKBP-type peptidyl-prolyl cis-trans isomerase [Hymenobacteraceae bacterium]